MIVERKSRKGRMFYGCANYPKCDFVSWDRVVPEPCPVCGDYVVAKNRARRRGAFECHTDKEHDMSSLERRRAAKSRRRARTRRGLIVPERLTVIGGGLAGCEAAWQAANARRCGGSVRDAPATQRPRAPHRRLAELVCSNSLRGAALENAVGLLKKSWRGSIR